MLYLMLQLSTEFYEDPEQVLGHRWMNRVTEHQVFLPDRINYYSLTTQVTTALDI